MTVKDTADRAAAYAGDKLATASDKLHDAGAHLRDSAEAAKAGASDSLAAAKEKIVDAYDVAREKTGIAADAAREKAVDVRQRASDGLVENPIGALVGGIALGVLVGALLPRTQREAETLGPIGEKIGLLAKNAFAAAKEAGQDTLDEMGVNKQNARAQVDKLIDTASKAASSAGSAAAGTIKS